MIPHFYQIILYVSEKVSQKELKSNHDNKIGDEKLQHDINREAAQITALSSSKLDKYELLTGKKVLPSDQNRIIEKDKFTYFSLGKHSKKQKQLRIKEEINSKL